MCLEPERIPRWLCVPGVWCTSTSASALSTDCIVTNRTLAIKPAAPVNTIRAFHYGSTAVLLVCMCCLCWWLYIFTCEICRPLAHLLHYYHGMDRVQCLNILRNKHLEWTTHITKLSTEYDTQSTTVAFSQRTDRHLDVNLCNRSIDSTEPISSWCYGVGRKCIGQEVEKFVDRPSGLQLLAPTLYILGCILRFDPTSRCTA